MYEFSTPLPYEMHLIDEIISINKKIEKSQIITFYQAFPSNCEYYTGFEQNRVLNYKNGDKIEYWENLIKYSMDKGFDFVYLLNSPRSFPSDTKLLDIQLEKLDLLLNKLKSLHCYKLRVSNSQLLNYLRLKYPEFKLYASTSFEFTQMKQYTNFLQIFPEIVELVPSYDVNKNFTLLKNLRKNFPDVDIEIMVTEGCLAGCPIRYHHNISFPFVYTKTYAEREHICKTDFFSMTCEKLHKANILEQLCLTNAIYPWEIEEYGKIGINKFKLVGRNMPAFISGKHFDFYEKYLKGIDDYSNIEDEDFKILNFYLFNSNAINVKIKEIKQYLPDIKHFIQHGEKCASICSGECTYCYNCADKIRKYLQQKDENK